MTKIDKVYIIIESTLDIIFEVCATQDIAEAELLLARMRYPDYSFYIEPWEVQTTPMLKPI